MKKTLVIHCIVLSVFLIAALLLSQFWTRKYSVSKDSTEYENYIEVFSAAKKECMKLLNNQEFCKLADALYEEASESDGTYYLLYVDYEDCEAWAGIEHPLITEDVSIYKPKLSEYDELDFTTSAPDKVLQAYNNFLTTYYRHENDFSHGEFDDQIFHTIYVYKDQENEFIRFDLAGKYDHFFLVRGNPEDAMKFNAFLEYVSEDPEEYDIILYSQCMDTPYPWYMVYFLY